MTPQEIEEQERSLARVIAAEAIGFEAGQLSDSTKLNGLSFGALVQVAYIARKRLRAELEPKP
jgi:hypothetical protein